jgi:hypothetical protein
MSTTAREPGRVAGHKLFALLVEIGGPNGVVCATRGELATRMGYAVRKNIWCTSYDTAQTYLTRHGAIEVTHVNTTRYIRIVGSL